jgi:hypothetical protein
MQECGCEIRQDRPADVEVAETLPPMYTYSLVHVRVSEEGEIQLA